MRSLRTTPISITSTSVKNKKVRTILSNSASQTYSEHAHVKAKYDLATVHFKGTVAKNIELASEFILARETVVRFVQDSAAEAVDRQKRNTDKKEGHMFFCFMKATYSYYLR